MENHGIVIAADSIQEIHELLSSARDKAGQKIKQKSMKSAISQASIGEYRPVADVDIHSLATSETLLKLVRRAWAISPDHVVFLGGEPAIVDSLSVLETLGSMGTMPRLLFLSKALAFIQIRNSTSQVSNNCVRTSKF